MSNTVFNVNSPMGHKISLVVLIIAAFGIPVSIALQNIGFVLVCLTGVALAWQQFRGKWVYVKNNALSLVMLSYFLWVCIGVFYTNADPDWLFKVFLEQLYLLGFFPILLCLYGKPQRVFTTLMLSYVISCLMVFVMGVLGHFGWLPKMTWFENPAPYYAFFKIYGALFMAFGGFIALNLMIFSNSKCWQWFYGVSFVLITYNVLWMSLSRSGYVIYVFLLLLAIFQRNNKKVRLLALIAVVLLGLLVIFTSGNFKVGISRIDQGVTKYTQHDPRTSTGIRMAYVKNSIKLWRAKPILGYGTGGFLKPYAQMGGIQAGGGVSTLANPQTNPENTYMYVLVEHGLIGLILLLLLYFLQIRYSFKMTDPLQRCLAQGFSVLVILFGMAGNLLLSNSPMVFFIFFSAVLFADYQVNRGHNV